MRAYYRTPPSAKAHWSAWFIHTHLKIEGMTHTEFLRLSGFPRSTMQRFWRGEVSPRVIELEIMLEVFGYKLKPSPREIKK